MDFTQFLLAAPVLLFSLVAHEYAHGYAAFRQGDTTAAQLGRLTWNPVRHIDPVLTVLIPVMTWFGSGGTFLFGGAKPIPVDPRNYRHLRRGDIIVSLAGVATNFVLALVFTVAAIALGALANAVPDATPSLAILQQMMLAGVRVNLVLGVFNLLPIPPLDGSHVAKYLLPPAWARSYQSIGRFGVLVLLLFLTVARPILQVWMTPAAVLYGGAFRAATPFLLPAPWL